MPAWNAASGNMWAGGCSDQAALVKETAPNPKAEIYEFPVLDGDPDKPEELLYDRVSAVFQGGFKLKVYSGVASSLDDYYLLAYVTADEYAAGHLPGAVHYLPNTDLDDTESLHYLPTDKQILVYSCSGQASAAVAATLNVLGYDAYTLKFGMNSLWHSDLQECKWSNDLIMNYPVE